MNRKHTRRIGLCAAGAFLLLSTGCQFTDDLLSVNNPEEIQVETLNDVKLLEVQLNGVVDAIESAYSFNLQYAQYGTDEVLTGLNWEDYARVNQRIISYLDGPTASIFELPSKGLRMGHDLAERIRVWATENPTMDLDGELAKALAFAGYGAVILAENMCQAVISPDPDEPSATVLSQLETFQAAIPYLTEALSVAQTAGDANLQNLARTALARAYLGLGNWAEAANYGNQVTPGFEWWIEFMDVSGARNPLQGTSHGGNFTLGIHPSFTGVHPSFNGTGFAFEDNDVIAPQTDPRIQHEITDRTGHNTLTRLYKLFQGLRYGDYNGETIAPSSGACPGCTGTSASSMPLLAEYDTDVLLADYTEAQHHYYEALAMQGGNEVAVLAFVNARRAVGNQAAVALTGQALITELRNQRARDLFMGGFRLPDLRRWTRFDAGNGPFTAGSYFPTGTHPNSQWGAYGDWTCFPIPLSEYEGNGNLTAPANPNTPPGI